MPFFRFARYAYYFTDIFCGYCLYYQTTFAEYLCLDMKCLQSCLSTKRAEKVVSL